MNILSASMPARYSPVSRVHALAFAASCGLLATYGSTAAAATASVITDESRANANADPTRAKALQKIQVKARAVDQYRAYQASSGALGERSLLDTPFSIDAVTETLIRNRQANNLLDVFKGDASATPISTGYTSENSLISVRGLQMDALNGYHINGLTVPAWATDLPIEHFQQIELLKGLGGFMYGFGQPGGMLNFVTKQPTDQTTARLRVGFSSRGPGPRKSMSVDVLVITGSSVIAWMRLTSRAIPMSMAATLSATRFR